MTLSCEEQLRRDLLLKALEVFRDTEAAITATLQLERFVRSGDPVSVAGSLSARQDVREDDPCLRLVPPVECPPLASEVGRRQRWTEADDALLRRLWSEGLTARAIAERLPRSEASIATRASVQKLARAADRPLICSAGEAPNDEVAGLAALVRIQESDADKAAPRSAEGARTRRATNASRPANAKTDATRNGRSTPEQSPGSPNGPIETVIHFLRSRDYSVVRTDEGRFRLDEREDLTAQELLNRANKVRALLRQPPFSAMASQCPEFEVSIQPFR